MSVEEARASPVPSQSMFGQPVAAPAAAAGAAAAVPVAEVPVHPIARVCNKMYDACKAEQWCEALALFEELKSIEGLENELSFEKDVTRAWGRAIEATRAINMARSGGAAADSEEDQEMLRELLDELAAEFDERFGYKSPFLQALLLEEADPLAAVRTLAARNGLITSDAVDGVLERHRNAPHASIRLAVQFLRAGNVTLSPETQERLQKLYVVAMKTADPEAVYGQMLADGVKPTVPHAYNILFAKTGTARTPKEYYEDMISYGVKPTASTYRVLAKVNGGGFDREDMARFRRLAKGDTAPDSRYLDKLQDFQHDGNLEQATALFHRMVCEGMVPDRHVYNRLIMCCRRHPERAEDWYKRMLEDKVEPNTVTFTNLITVWKDSRLVDSCEHWIREMMRRGMQLDQHNYSALLDAYVRAGHRVRAQQLFRQLLDIGSLGIAGYNTAIKIGPFDWGLGVLALLLADGLQPTSHTRSHLQALSKDDDTDRYLHELSDCHWLKENILRCDALINPPRGTRPSLKDCLRFVLRELQIDDAALTKRTEMLRDEIDRARAA